MDQVVREQIRAWKAAVDADNELVLAEKRNRTPAQRMMLLRAFIQGHGQIQISRSKPESRDHKMPYKEVQERLSGRNSKRSGSI